MRRRPQREQILLLDADADEDRRERKQCDLDQRDTQAVDEGYFKDAQDGAQTDRARDTGSADL